MYLPSIHIAERVDLGLLYNAMSLQIYDELSSFTNFALYLHRSSHLLDDILADRQSEARALGVPFWIFIQFCKIYKQIVAALIRYANASVYDA